MSIAPEAFEWLRHETYAHARNCGDEARQYEPLRAWCEARLTEWLSQHPERADMAGGQLQATASGVARYVAENYRPQRRRTAPQRTRDQRAAEALTIELFREIPKKPTVRNVALAADMSRSKAGRLLVRQGFAPGRKAKLTTLKPTARRILDVIDRVHGRDGDRVFPLDELAGQVWKRTADEALRRQHRKRIRDALREIAAAGISIHVETSTTHAAIRRGRRWKAGEAAAAPAAAPGQPRMPLNMILAAPVIGGPFWSSPEIRRAIAALRITSGERLPYEDLPLFIRAHADIRAIDPTPLAWLLSNALQSYNSDDLAYEQMHRSSTRLCKEGDPVRRQTGRDLARIANTFYLLREDGKWGRCAYDCLGTVLHETRIREGCNLSGQRRIDRLRKIVDDLWHEDPEADVNTALALCKRLAEREAAEHQASDYSDVPF